MKRFLFILIATVALASVPSMAQLAGITFVHNSGDVSIPVVDVWITQSGGTQKVEDISYQRASNLNSIFIFGDIEVMIEVAPGNSTDRSEAIASLTFTPLSDAGYVVVLHGVNTPANYASNPDAVATKLAMTQFNVPVFDGNPTDIGTMFFHGSSDHEKVDARIRGAKNPIAADRKFGTQNASLVSLTRELSLLDLTKVGDPGKTLATFEIDFSAISSETIVLVLSGFKTPGDNQDGSPLVLLGVTESGNVIRYPIQEGSQTASVQLIHNATDPSLTVVDVYVNETRVVDNMRYLTASTFTDLPASQSVVVGIAPFGSTGWADTIKTVTLPSLRAGRNYQIMVTGVADTSKFAKNPQEANIELDVILIEGALKESDDPEGKTRVRTVHGSTDAGFATIHSAKGVRFSDSVAYGSISPGYTTVEAGLDTLWLLDTAAQPIRGWEANLSGNKRATVLLATGFVAPDMNDNGPAFKLVLIDATGNVSSSLKEVNPPAVSVNEEILRRSEWTLSPNPVLTTTQLTLPTEWAGKELTCEVFNLSGSSVLTQRINTNGNGVSAIDLTGVATGSYLMRLVTDNGSVLGSTIVVVER